MDRRWGDGYRCRSGRGEKSDSRDASWEARKRKSFQEEKRKERRGASMNGRQEGRLLQQEWPRENKAEWLVPTLMSEPVRECRLKTSRLVCTLGRESWHTLCALHTFHGRAGVIRSLAGPGQVSIPCPALPRSLGAGDGNGWGGRTCVQPRAGELLPRQRNSRFCTLSL